MSDISFYGLAAVIIFFSLAIVSLLGFVVSGFSFWFFKNAKAKGFLLASVSVLVLSVISIFTIEEQDNIDLLKWMDNYAIFIALFVIASGGWYGLRYYKRKI